MSLANEQFDVRTATVVIANSARTQNAIVALSRSIHGSELEARDLGALKDCEAYLDSVVETFDQLGRQGDIRGISDIGVTRDAVNAAATGKQKGDGVKALVELRKHLLDQAESKRVSRKMELSSRWTRPTGSSIF